MQEFSIAKSLAELFANITFEVEAMTVNVTNNIVFFKVVSFKHLPISREILYRKVNITFR